LIAANATCEVATLLWAALGFRRDGTRNKFRINQHLTRFILIGLYTGTRHDAILKLQWMPHTEGDWFDLEIPARLTPHLRRWKRLSTQYAIEFNGQRIASQLRRAWAGARDMSGPGSDVTPHVLKHSCATLMLQAGVSTWNVAGLLGTNEAVIRKTYGHHAIEHLRIASDVWSKRPAMTGQKANRGGFRGGPI
jgi:integrase